MSKSKEYLTFLKELPKSFQEIGGIIPSSPALARAMVRPLREARKSSLRILEVGPGTGPFTRRILKLMRPGDELLICEINPEFVRQLKGSLPRSRHYAQHKDRIRFHEGPVQDLGQLNPPVQFDVIVSSLPFTNFQPELVEEILNLFGRLLSPGGHVAFCEYVGLRTISGLVFGGEQRARLKGVDHVVDSWMSAAKQTGKVRRELSLFNFPPAFTFVVDQTGAAANTFADGFVKNGSRNGATHFPVNGLHRNGVLSPGALNGGSANGHGTSNGHGHSNGYKRNGLHR